MSFLTFCVIYAVCRDFLPVDLSLTTPHSSLRSLCSFSSFYPNWSHLTTGVQKHGNAIHKYYKTQTNNDCTDFSKKTFFGVGEKSGFGYDRACWAGMPRKRFGFIQVFAVWHRRQSVVLEVRSTFVRAVCHSDSPRLVVLQYMGCGRDRCREAGGFASLFHCERRFLQWATWLLFTE